MPVSPFRLAGTSPARARRCERRAKITRIQSTASGFAKTTYAISKNAQLDLSDHRLLAPTLENQGVQEPSKLSLAPTRFNYLIIDSHPLNGLDSHAYTRAWREGRVLFQTPNQLRLAEESLARETGKQTRPPAGEKLASKPNFVRLGNLKTR
jgi:hypothetical protein